MKSTVAIHVGDCLEQLRTLPDESVQCCVTSPPYWGLRDYGADGQIGLEETPEAFVDSMVEVFREVRRVLRPDGVCFVNLGDSYAGSPCGSFNGGGFKDASAESGGRDMSGVATSGTIDKVKASGLKPKDLVGIPWRVAFALQSDGWYLRQDIIWHKPNPMPESVKDRCTKAHEYVFLLTKSGRYYWDAGAIAESAIPQKRTGKKGYRCPKDVIDIHPNRTDGARVSDKTGLNGPTGETRNARSVWAITTKGFSGCHFATFPPELPMKCIAVGSKKGDTVLDPFFGAGTTGLVAMKMGRNCIGIELNPEYAEIARKRIAAEAGLFGKVNVVNTA